MIPSATLRTIVKTIVEHQKSIIGPLAVEQASKVPGITVSNTGTVDIKTNDSKKLLSDLIHSYSELFGNTSIEVCKEAIKESQVSIPNKELPDVLL